jgi:OmpA-OmpF porin, OOP family
MLIFIGKIWLCLLAAAGLGWLVRHLVGNAARSSTANGFDPEGAGTLSLWEEGQPELRLQVGHFETIAAQMEDTTREPNCNLGEQMLEQWNLTSITFPVDSSKITASAAERLNHVLPALSELVNRKVKITGHTDTIGSEVHNRDLSLRRAEAVRDYLIARGVVAPVLFAEGHGGTRPIADNAIDEGRIKNRRIEFFVYK